MAKQDGFSLRERRWLQSLAAGPTVGEVAAAEGYSPRHMRRILAGVYERLGATGRIPALVAAARLGLLDDEPDGAGGGG